MNRTHNIYCDESGHMEHDSEKVMVLGAVWCPLEKTQEISMRLKEIKGRHGLSKKFETKWTKVSPAKMQFYLDVMDYFFDDDDLHFRALIVPDKSKLSHEDFSQSHDDWYYKMYFDMLKVILSPSEKFRIYLDIKDTRSAAKIAKLHEVLRNKFYDFSGDIIERVQTVRSHEIEILQLADLLIGTIAYVNKGRTGNAGKEALVSRMKERSHYTLTLTTLLREDKVNLFCWRASEGF